MFSTRLRGGKAFAAEQKIRELKKLLLKVLSTAFLLVCFLKVTSSTKLFFAIK